MRTIIIIIAVIAVFLALFGILYFSQDRPEACTEEAKVCPDGTTVERALLDCEFEKCPEESKEYSLSCEKDEDCRLIDRDRDFVCSLCGSCEEIDYAEDKYIAVNSSSFTEYYESWEQENCPELYNCRKEGFPFEECEDYMICPACETFIVDRNITAECIDNRCEKVNEDLIPDPDCTSNIYNCPDFSTHAEAQLVFEKCGGVENDVHGLDRDKDGVVCEGLG